MSWMSSVKENKLGSLKNKPKSRIAFFVQKCTMWGKCSTGIVWKALLNTLFWTL